MTDVTGFGLLGHLHELCAASEVSADIEAAAVPAIDGALDLLADGDAVSGGSRRNRDFVGAVHELRRLRSGGAARAPVRRDDLGRPAGRRGPCASGRDGNRRCPRSRRTTARIGTLGAGPPGTLAVS